eukprot:scaffold1426_cov73-Isochrysis_galbana.AAC.1
MALPCLCRGVGLGGKVRGNVEGVEGRGEMSSLPLFSSSAHRTAATSDGRDVCATPARGDVTCTEINPSPRICAFTPETPHVDSSARALASPAQAASIFRPGDRATMPPEA